MHELGVATALLDTVIGSVDKTSCICVEKIDVVVGKKAAIIDEMFTEAFNALKELDEYSLCKNAIITTTDTEGKDVYIDKIQIKEKD